MRAIILAAGKGVRLNGTAGNKPKCLLNVGATTLIERQIRSLRLLGVSSIVAVVGCGADIVRDTCGADCSYVVNEQFGSTNSLFSLWLARDQLRDGFIVLNSDVLFDPEMLDSLLVSPHEDALLFEPNVGRSQVLGDEEMKVRLCDGTVSEISKNIDPSLADGENVGIAKFGKTGASLIVECMDAMIALGGHREWAPRAFQEFAKQRPLFAVSTAGRPWIEIDFPEDYLRACTEILPLIEQDKACRGRSAEPLAAAELI